MKDKSMPTGLIGTMCSRDEALDQILPKFLGSLWENGKKSRVPGGVKANIGQNIEVHGIAVHPNSFVLSVCVRQSGRSAIIVFSAHLAPDASVVNPRYFPYQSGRCGILSWKRGPWEDQLAAAGAKPRSISRLLKAGLMKA
jgi:hypothetical protein